MTVPFPDLLSHGSQKGRIIITLGCTLFGFLGVCARYFFAHGLNSFEVSFIRQSLTLFPMFLLAWAARFVEATTLSVITMVEIVVAALAGFAFYQESLSVSNIVDMVLVMSSVVILNIRIKKGADKYRAKQNSGNSQIESKT